MLKKTTALLAMVLSSVSGSCQQLPRWSPQKANAWYAQQPWLVGANYIPSDAINQFEMFQSETWNPQLVDKELDLAQGIGMNTMRVFLQDQLWSQNPVGFQKRLDEFLTIASRHGIRPMLVLFDSCWDPHPKPGLQPAPTPGVHNSHWVQSPGSEELANPAYEPALESYVKGIVGAFAKDDRILAWDVWNEPDNVNDHYGPELPNKVELVDSLLPKVFAWARSVHPTQPLTSGVWGSGNWSNPALETATARIQLAQSDILTFHHYDWPESFEARIRELQSAGRPILCTEYMARGAGSTFDGDLPIAKHYKVGAINWGFVAGKTQTYLPWDSWEKPYIKSQPPIWFHDIFRSDSTPYRQYEVDLMRTLTGRGKPPSTTITLTH